MFHEIFKNKTDKELLEIINSPDSYQKDAIIAATEILQERDVEVEQGHVDIVEELKVESKQEKETAEKADITLGWSIFFAMLIDLLLLSAISYAIGFLMMYLSLANQNMNLIVSAILIIGYFAIAHSKIFNGKTLGKRLLELEVVDKRGRHLSLIASLLRSLILIFPFFLFEFLDNLTLNSKILNIIIDTLSYSYIVSVFYFFLVDKQSRRSIHDLISETLVVKKDTYKEYKQLDNKFLNYFLGIVAILLILASTPYIDFNKNSVETASSITNLQSTLTNNTEVFTEIINELSAMDGIEAMNEIKIKHVNNNRTDLIIDVQSDFYPLDGSGENLATNIYNSLEGKRFQLDRLDNVKVIVNYGFQMTLAKYTLTFSKNWAQ